MPKIPTNGLIIDMRNLTKYEESAPLLRHISVLTTPGCNDTAVTPVPFKEMNKQDLERNKNYWLLIIVSNKKKRREPSNLLASSKA